MNQNKLTIYNCMESKPLVVEFDNEAYFPIPNSLRDWELVYAGILLGNDGIIVDDVVLEFNGETYIMDEDGHFVKEDK